MFEGKILLITGGTGSFGNAVLRRLIKSDISQIRIFSRDEKKQDDMRHEYEDLKLKFYIGDVRNKSSIAEAMNGVDFVFHAAALKQVPSCEFYRRCDERCGFRVPCSGAQTGTLLRVLSYGGDSDQYTRRRKRS